MAFEDWDESADIWCSYVVADLGSKAGCDALCADVKKKTDRLTVLVNNSGATWYAIFPP